MVRKGIEEWFIAIGIAIGIPLVPSAIAGLAQQLSSFKASSSSLLTSKKSRKPVSS